MCVLVTHERRATTPGRKKTWYEFDMADFIVTSPQSSYRYISSSCLELGSSRIYHYLAAFVQRLRGHAGSVPQTNTGG